MEKVQEEGERRLSAFYYTAVHVFDIIGVSNFFLFFFGILAICRGCRGIFLEKDSLEKTVSFKLDWNLNSYACTQNSIFKKQKNNCFRYKSALSTLSF